MKDSTPRKILFLSLLLCAPLLFPQTEFLKGADISFLQQIEDHGGIYKENGVACDPITILKNHGINIIRIRLWNNPPDGYNNLTKLLIIAKRIKEANLKLLVDFHYSDSWADPGKQFKPAAWDSLNFNSLEDSLYQFTKNVLSSLKAQNTFPDIIQIGNEITSGILWNDGRVDGIYNTPAQWSNLTSLLKKCISAANEVRGIDTMKVMIHLDCSTDAIKCRWFFDSLSSYNVNFDYIGLSYYPWWHGAFNLLASNLFYLAARYHKPIIVAETGYPWTLGWDDTTNNYIGLPSQLLRGYPATVEGQKNFLSDLITIDNNIPDNLGKGVFYWEPLCITTPTLGSSMENLALFDFSANLLSSISAFENINSVNKETIPESGFTLLQNYPNPFNPYTIINFSSCNTSYISLKIFNILGKEIAVLFNGIAQGNKAYEIKFDGEDLPSGVYFYQIKGNGLLLTKKMILIK
jgi:arabinogalactan endo-1,4-beta-galactosidase